MNTHKTTRLQILRESFSILVMTAVLFGSQVLYLQHDHAEDITQHGDCSICLKQSNESESLPSSVAPPEVSLIATFTFSEPESDTYFTYVVTRSRSPPLA